MGTQKKEKSRRAREGDVRDGNLRVKGENFYRDAKKVKHLLMYKKGRATRNAKGEIIRAADLQSTDAPVARVDPNRKWFGNTRVIAQDALTHFRQAMGEKKNDTYQILLKRNKLPMSLLDEKDQKESPTANILETESFSSTFGPKQQRKKPRFAASSLEELALATEGDATAYEEKQELDATLGLMGGSFLDKEDYTQEAKEAIFHKGQSKRIWNELYKVIDSSDVVIHVLDARDPLGTRCESVEKYIREECPHKHLIYVLNKCDLVPTWVAVCTKVTKNSWYGWTQRSSQGGTAFRHSTLLPVTSLENQHPRRDLVPAVLAGLSHRGAGSCELKLSRAAQAVLVVTSS